MSKGGTCIFLLALNGADIGGQSAMPHAGGVMTAVRRMCILLPGLVATKILRHILPLSSWLPIACNK